MSFDLILSFILLIFIIWALIREIYPAATILFIALSIFFFTGVISFSDALSGFHNKGMITVGLLFLISRAVQNTGALRDLSTIIFKNKVKENTSPVLWRMLIPVSAFSAFLNNTPIVVMFTPIVKSWAERNNISPSKFLIPLSYAAILGGTCTLIGTSTNLVVHGLLLENGFKGFSMFELSAVGIPITIIGLIYLGTIGKKILPDRKDILGSISENPKEYIVEMRVLKGCRLIGKKVKEAGLRNLEGVYLVEIEKSYKRIKPVSGNDLIEQNDKLIFSGLTSAILDLNKINGLEVLEQNELDQDYSILRDQFVEVVVSTSSPFKGKTVKEAHFRSEYGAAIVAVHRNGERIKSKIGEITLREGDNLLLLTGENFTSQWKNHRDFFLVSEVDNYKRHSFKKMYMTMTILSLMVIAASIGQFLPGIRGNQIDMFYAAVAAVLLLVIMGLLKNDEAKDSIQWNVLLTIACAFGISKALQNSGLAELIASAIVNTFKIFGPLGILTGIYILTNLFTELITNTASAAFVFPIALSAAQQFGVSPEPFFITITISASASFMTPIGYQTNLIVQGAGGYKFTDYVKIGLPLNIMVMIASLIIIPLVWKF